MPHNPGKARCKICYRSVSYRRLRDHYRQEHQPPERCSKCGQRGEGMRYNQKLWMRA